MNNQRVQDPVPNPPSPPSDTPEHDDHPDSSLSSPSSPPSPLTPPDDSRHSSSEIPDADEEKESEAGPIRTKSSRSNSIEVKEKRKRSRVTPEQLVHLERYFSMDRSPTAARRKEISETLGMQERQTQIWFQNRRAKAKLQDGKNKGRGLLDLPPDAPPELCAGFDANLHQLIHEHEPVTIIPCTDLSIGTWKRIATTVSRHDLVAYICESRHCLTWFIHSSGCGFKMEIPFDIIVDTKFTNASPGTGLATFILSRPPSFFMESGIISPPMNNQSPIQGWKRCADWTEGQQATKVLRHDLLGSAVQLAHVLRNLNAHSAGSEIALHPPGYRQSTSSSPGSTPSLDGFSPQTASSDGIGGFYGANTYDRQRSYSDGSLLMHQPPRSLGPSPPLPAHLSHSANTSPNSTGYPSLFSPDYSTDPAAPKRDRFRPPHLDLSSAPNYHQLSTISHSLSRRQSYDDAPLSAHSHSTHSSYSSPSPAPVPVPTPPFSTSATAVGGYWSGGARLLGNGIGLAQRMAYDVPLVHQPAEYR